MKLVKVKESAVHQRQNGLPSRTPKKKMKWPDYAKAACRQILDNAERQKLPRPTICFLLDEESVDHGPYVFPIVPRMGEFIEPEWLGHEFDSFSTGYEVIGVEHCVPDGFTCEVPYLQLYVRLNQDRFETIYHGADARERSRQLGKRN